MTGVGRVLVLGGGPDAEREVSLRSARAVAQALESLPDAAVTHQEIDRLSGEQLAALPGDVVFPVLHGGWGEGGPLQELLEADGRPYVGSGPGAARLAMDKIATKLVAASIGVRTAPAAVLNLGDASCPFPFPVVLKPVHEGSSVGVHMVRDGPDWARALDAVRADRAAHPSRVFMVERAVLAPGGRPREMTVGLLDARALTPIEILPAEGFYDYHAKYNRRDTRYVVAPAIPDELTRAMQRAAEDLTAALGVRHLARVDFLIDPDGAPMMLEVNTMPGFTGSSLLPKAAAHDGFAFPDLCRTLLDLARRDRPGGRGAGAGGVR